MAERDLPPVPYKVPLLDRNGLVTSVWAAWFRQLFFRVGGNQALTNNELGSSLELDTGKIFIGDDGTPTGRTVSGDITLSSTGVAAISAGVIVDADVKSDAGISHSKLATMTAGRVLLGNGTNVPTATAVSGDVTIDSLGVTTVGANKITNAKLAQMAANTIKGNNTGSTANASDLTAAQATAMLDAFTGDSGSGGVKGLVPAPASGDAAASKYLKADGTWTTVDASGGGGINYIENPDAEIDTTGWATYADAAGASPVDGTGGTANITFTRTTSDPLRETASFLITKDAANRQGEGVSYDFTIARADSTSGTGPKVQQITADYEIASGTYGYGTSSTDSDLTCYIYDVTNSQVIQPSGYKFDGGQFQATFQPNSDSTSYRLCLHIATTSASAWTLKLDNVKVGPQVVPSGVASKDAAQYTPSNTQGFGTISGTDIWWWRLGGFLHLYGKFTSGTMTGSAAQLGLPSGCVIGGSSGVRQYVGEMIRNGGSRVTVMAVQGNNYVTFGGGASSHGDVVGTSLLGNSETVYLRGISIPITGWSSNTLVSDSADTRVVACNMYRSTAQTLAPNAAAVKVSFNAVENDTHGGFDSANGRYSVKVPGFYHLDFRISVGGTNVLGNRYFAIIYKNGGTASLRGDDNIATANQIFSRTASGIMYLNAGDYIEGYLYGAGNNSVSTLTGETDSSVVYLSLTRISGPSQIAASEVIAARYTSASSAAVPNSATVFDFGTKSFDTHGAVTTGASWKFTAPARGFYRAAAVLSFTGSGSASRYDIALRKNGVAVDTAFLTTTGANVDSSAINSIIELNAGDYIDITHYETVNGGTYAGTGQFISIERIGGVL